VGDPRPSHWPANVDPFTGAGAGIDWAHRAIHDGRSFSVTARNLALAAGGTLVLAWRTPPTTERFIHILVSWLTEEEGVMELLEGATWDINTGTAAAIYCRNRVLDSAAKLLENIRPGGTFEATQALVQDPTTLTGPVIYRQSSFVGRAAEGIRRGEHEWILKPSTNYAVRVTNENGVNKGGEIEIDWYELVVNP
jgi:hypothetical protein